MTPTTRPSDANQILRRLTNRQAVDFCSRLLRHSTDRVLTFREFHATARELIDERPRDAALFLAALVAIEVNTTTADGPLQKGMPPHSPSQN